MGPKDRPARPLYTQAERHRRDTSPWTLVQGVLAPLQFAIFLVSLVLVLRAWRPARVSSPPKSRSW